MKLVNRECSPDVMAPVTQRLPMMAGTQAGFSTMNAELAREVERRARDRLLRRHGPVSTRGPRRRTQRRLVGWRLVACRWNP